jgi:hypothetical protein
MLEWVIYTLEEETHRNNFVEDTNESVGARTASAPADLRTEIIAHADTCLNIGLVHNTCDVVNDLELCISTS